MDCAVYLLQYAHHLCSAEKFLFKPVKKMIDDRQQEIDTMYADADAAKQKAADLEKYADHLQSIKDERDAMLRESDRPRPEA